MTRTVVLEGTAIETATVTVIEIGNVAVMGVDMMPLGSTTATGGAAEATEVETTTTEVTTGTIAAGEGTIVLATTPEGTRARATRDMIEATIAPPTTATTTITAEEGGTRTIVLGAEALLGTTMEEGEGKEGKLFSGSRYNVDAYVCAWEWVY